MEIVLHAEYHKKVEQILGTRNADHISLQFEETCWSQFEQQRYSLKLNGPDRNYSESVANAVSTQSEIALLSTVPLSGALRMILMTQLSYFSIMGTSAWTLPMIGGIGRLSRKDLTACLTSRRYLIEPRSSTVYYAVHGTAYQANHP